MPCCRRKSPRRLSRSECKKTRLDAITLLVLAVLGGAFIAPGGMFATTVLAGAIWLSYGARSTSDKILAVLFPVSAFVVAGFEHSVANMYLIPLGPLIKEWAPDSLWPQIGATPSDFADLTGPDSA